MAFFLKNALIPDATADGGYGYRLVDVHLAGGLIASIAPAAASPPPPGASVVDCTDKLLLPGMVNGHAHSAEHVRARGHGRERRSRASLSAPVGARPR